MEFVRTMSALVIALGLGMTGAVSAAPLATSAPRGGDLVTPVAYDCHEDVRFHFLPDYGRKVWHRHRQSNCRVVVVDRHDNDDDYDRPRDCHRDVRRHYLREYGAEVTHKHVGESCRVKVYRQHSGGGDGSCIRIGPITYCEN